MRQFCVRTNQIDLHSTFFNLFRIQTHEVTLSENNWRNMVASRPASREDMMRVLSNLEAIKIRATFQSHMTYTTLSGVTMDTAVAHNTGQGQISDVEQCRCPEGYRGTSCEVGSIKSLTFL